MRKQNNPKLTILSVVLCGLAVVGFSDTAQAQIVTLTGVNGTNPNYSLNVTAQAGGVSGVYQVQVTTSDDPSTVDIQVNPPSSWLQVAEAPGGLGNPNTPVTLHISVNAATLTAGTMPTGTITIAPVGAPHNAVVLTVTATITAGSLLSSTPATLSFSAPVGTPESSIATQQLTISSSGQQLSYTVSASTTDGNLWLIPFNTSGTTGNSSTDTITVGVNPGNLVAGSYTGTITVKSTSTTDTVAINVTFTLTSAATLSVTPGTLQPFLYQVGTQLQSGQLTQTIQVSSTGTSVPFQVTMNPQVSWLVISPTTSATGTGGAAVPVTLSANPTGLQPGVYNTAITVAIINGPALSPMPVQLVVSNNPLLSLSTNTLAFSAAFGASSPPASQSVQVGAVGSQSTSVSFSVNSDQAWLSYTAPSFSTPATLTVTANPASLPVGSYTGHLTVTPNNSDRGLYSLTVTVTFTIGNVAQVTAGPPLLVFSWETSQPFPQPQVLALFTAGQPTTFQLSTSSTSAANCPASWLNATSNSSTTLNATITVNANVTGMTPGICSGTVTVSYPAGSISPQTLAIPVAVNVSNSALLNISMPLGFGVVTAAQGSSQVTETITLTSTDPSVPVTDIAASASSNGPAPWLFLGQSGSSTPQALQVIIAPGTLPTNTYAGTISISSSKLPSSPLSIPVTLTVTSTTTVAITPTSLTFNQAQGGPVPAQQSVSLSQTGTGATFQVSVPSIPACSWLQVSPTSGAATGPVAFSVLQNSLVQASYPCQVVFSFLNSATQPISVTATLVVGPAQTLGVSPNSLTYSYQIGASAPASQQIVLTSTGGAVSYTAAAASTGGWLSIDSTSGSTGSSGTKSINVSVDPTKFPGGTQAGTALPGTITISAPGVLANPTVVNVTVNVVAAAAPQPVTITNSTQPTSGFGAIAPGEIITIRGTNLGPATCSPPAVCISGGYSFTVGSNGIVASTLGGVQVLFDTIPGTPMFVSATEINVIVPWEVAGRTSTNMVVAYNNVESAAFPLQVAQVAPGIYTQNATGAGNAAALNLSSQAASVYNGPAGGTYFGTSLATAPAPAGSVVVLILTGGGLTSPVLVDGQVTPSQTLYPLKNWTPTSGTVTATVGGQPATVIFAGAPPTLISGAVQVNLQLPAGVTGTNVPVIITIDGVQTQTTATLAIQ